MLNCDGKCILAKKIATAQEQKNQTNDPTTPPIPHISLQYLPGIFQMNFDRYSREVIHGSLWLDPNRKSFIIKPFKPPV